VPVDMDISHHCTPKLGDGERREMTMASQWNAPKGVSTETPTKRTTRRRRPTADAAPAARRRAVLLELSRLERLFEQNKRTDPRVFVRARKGARARAMEVLERGGPGAENSRTALLVAAAELLVPSGPSSCPRRPKPLALRTSSK
jgi:hypothetical protein